MVTRAVGLVALAFLFPSVAVVGCIDNLTANGVCDTNVEVREGYNPICIKSRGCCKDDTSADELRLWQCADQQGCGPGGGAGGGDTGGSGGSGEGGSCGDTLSDPHNCGSCGHSCRGGTCSNGVCQPVLVAAQQNRPWDTAVDADFVYWINQSGSQSSCDEASDGAVRRAGISGGSVEVIADGQSCPLAVSLDQATVFWITLFSLKSRSKAGGATAVLASPDSQNSMDGLIADGGTLYWIEGPYTGPGTSIRSMPSVGGQVTTVATEPIAGYESSINTIAVADDWIYALVGPPWQNDEKQVKRVNRNGGALVVVAPNVLGAAAISSNGNQVAWGSGDGSIFLVQNSAAKPDAYTTWLTGQGGVADLKLDATNAYWTNGSDLRKRDLAGGATVEMLSGRSSVGAVSIGPSDIAWVEGTSIWRLAK